MESLQGKFLIASPRLIDPNFFRAVVLVVQHDQNGALGVVVNRPLQTTVKMLWEKLEEGEYHPDRADQCLYQGGPCDGPLMAAHTDEELSELEVAGGIHFATDKDTIEELVADNDADLKLFVGYAGWSPGQLETEMEEGSWMVAAATAEQVFDPQDDQWTTLMKSLAKPSPLAGLNPKVIPEDPSMN